MRFLSPKGEVGAICSAPGAGPHSSRIFSRTIKEFSVRRRLGAVVEGRDTRIRVLR